MFRFLDRQLEKASGGAGPMFRWIWGSLLVASLVGLIYVVVLLGA